MAPWMHNLWFVPLIYRLKGQDLSKTQAFSLIEMQEMSKKGFNKSSKLGTENRRKWKKVRKRVLQISVRKKEEKKRGKKVWKKFRSEISTRKPFSTLRFRPQIEKFGQIIGYPKTAPPPPQNSKIIDK